MVDLEVQLTGKAEDIIRLIDNIPKETEITVFGTNIQRERFGNPFSKFIRGEFSYRLGGEDSTATLRKTNFYFQHFNGNGLGNHMEDPISLKYDTYRLFEESGITPKVYKLDSIPQGILLSSVGDITLEERLVGRSLEERAGLYKAASETLLNFHLYTNSRLARIIAEEKVLEAIRRKNNKSSIGKAVESFCNLYRRIQNREPEEETEKEFAVLYVPISQIYDRYDHEIIHGDAGAQNFVSNENIEDWNPKDISIIDLTSLRLGTRMFDMANLATSYNMLLSPEEWNKGVIEYKQKEGGKEFQAFDKGLILGFGKKPVPLNPRREITKELLTSFYAAAVHKCLKRMGNTAKLAREFPEKYGVWACEKPALRYVNEEMGNNIRTALEYIVSKKEWAWDAKEIGILGSLIKFLENEGVIPSKGISKELEAKCRKEYHNSLRGSAFPSLKTSLNRERVTS